MRNLFLGFVVLFLAACSIYQSDARKYFEKERDDLATQEVTRAEDDEFQHRCEPMTHQNAWASDQAELVELEENVFMIRSQNLAKVWFCDFSHVAEETLRTSIRTLQLKALLWVRTQDE